MPDISRSLLALASCINAPVPLSLCPPAPLSPCSPVPRLLTPPPSSLLPLLLCTGSKAASYVPYRNSKLTRLLKV